jgi:hypothetical protein
MYTYYKYVSTPLSADLILSPAPLPGEGHVEFSLQQAAKDDQPKK